MYSSAFRVEQKMLPRIIIIQYIIIHTSKRNIIQIILNIIIIQLKKQQVIVINDYLNLKG